MQIYDVAEKAHEKDEYIRRYSRVTPWNPAADWNSRAAQPRLLHGTWYSEAVGEQPRD